jgi:hypothetical protein
MQNLYMAKSTDNNILKLVTFIHLEIWNQRTNQEFFWYLLQFKYVLEKITSLFKRFNQINFS